MHVLSAPTLQPNPRTILFRSITHRELEHFKESSLAQVKEFKNNFNPIVSKVSQRIIVGQ